MKYTTLTTCLAAGLLACSPATAEKGTSGGEKAGSSAKKPAKTKPAPKRVVEKVAAEKKATAKPAATADVPGEVMKPPRAKNLNLADLTWDKPDLDGPDGVMIHVLMGDPYGGPFTAIVKMDAGFAMPLHTHTSTFSAVTLTEGVVHAAKLEGAKPLPLGSTFVQPGGEPHVDACVSKTPCRFFISFEDKLDTQPAKAPAAEPKMTVTPADKLAWKPLIPKLPNGPNMVVVRGNPKVGPFLAMARFPAGFATNVHTHTAAFAGAVVSGTHHRGVGPKSLATLTPGAAWSEPSQAPHLEKCGDKGPCVLAFAMDGKMDQAGVDAALEGK